MNQLFTDGGVIGINPSPQGGTWAFRLLQDEQVVIERFGVITPIESGQPSITNNLTEMLALVMGLRALPLDWIGTVYSDSAITLGRAFDGWKWKGIPSWLTSLYQEARERLLFWDDIQHVLLAGHPTRAQLAAGIGRNGNPVSIHNVWCDRACHQAAVSINPLQRSN